MSDEVVIKVENVSKDFKLAHEKNTTLKSRFTAMLRGRKNRTTETQHALKNISFEVKKGEFFGIVGRNGSGKSTLLKILAEIYQPTKGQVHVVGKLVPFIELGVGFNPELTGRENVYLNGAILGFSKKEINEFYDEVVEFAELGNFMDKKLKNYSSGMQVRLAFSMAIRAKADILLIDEVLAVGDADFQRKCFSYFNELKINNKTVVFVSHDMNAVKKFCDRAALIEDSEIALIGSTHEVTSKYHQLFANNVSNKNGKIGEPVRWGAGGASSGNVRASSNANFIHVTSQIRVNKDLERLIYGMHIVANDGVEIMAMNNRMLKIPDIENIENGNKVNIEWEIPNILSSGDYRVMLTLINKEGEVVDWLTNAAWFSVAKDTESTTHILPQIKSSFKLVTRAKI